LFIIQRIEMNEKKNLTIEETFALAVQNHKKNNLQVAENLYNETLKTNPNYVDAHNNLGIVLNELGEYQKAKSCYEKAIQINPNYVGVHNNLGVVFNELGEYKKAINSYQKELRLKPNSINAQANISSIYISQLDDLKKAIRASYKALKIHHESSKFINQRISLYHLKHDVQQAEYLSSKNYKIDGLIRFKKLATKY